MIPRLLQEQIIEHLFTGKAILVIGARQVGKTTLIRQILSSRRHLFLDGDDPAVRNFLNSPNTEQIRTILEDHDIVFIDEAQRINEIGITLKIITDQFSGVQVIASGSSALELSGFASESLTGRKWTFTMFPVAWQEWESHAGYLKAHQDLENRMLFGMYPDVLNHPEKQARVLLELIDSYLFKDIFAMGFIRKPEVLTSLLQALAYQVGQEISMNELSRLLSIDTKTVDHYLTLLEQTYIIFRLPSFNRNLRNEIRKGKKIYFFDNGVRNAVIGNFLPLSNRQDTGALWENFMISERVKRLRYTNSLTKSHFWRTIQQQEVDYVEVTAEKTEGFEFKWNPLKKGQRTKPFVTAYQSDVHVIHRENFREFLFH